MPSLEAALDAEFDLAPLWRQADADAFLAAQGAGFVGLVTSVWGPVDAALLARLPNLRVISISVSATTRSTSPRSAPAAFRSATPRTC